ncbi:aldose-1-epimerase [Nemania serpens]|nr:aldose-1-epimerase [Nemania serpens]
MRLHTAVAALGALSLPFASADYSTNGPDENGLYWIYSKGLSAAFIPYGASISRLLINDQYGIKRDIVAGFDNASYYGIDGQHPHLGSVPGRYANRIGNSTFEIDGETYHVASNEVPTAASPNGTQTLHGGPDGWDFRNFTVVSHTNDSVTFSIVDPDGKEGFPGEVISYITYTVKDYTWDLKMVALATTKKTPIMLSSHTYWNLDGFSNNETQTALNHTLYLPYSGQRVGVDETLIPTGDILGIKKGSVNDFWSAPKQVGHSLTDPEAVGNCGPGGCVGYDNCWLINREEPYDWRADGKFVARLQSAWSGIQLEVYTNQEAFQVFSCQYQNGTLTLKETQGLHDDPDFPRTIPAYGCVVLEVEDWIGGINQPEWGRLDKQIFGPGDDPYVLQASYVFSINATATPP